VGQPTSAGRQDQVVVGEGYVLPVRVGYEDAFLVFVHPCDLGKDNGGVLLVSENSPDWKANLIGTQNRRCHSVEQGLKQVVICAIDQDDFRGRILESLGGGQSTKATADYNDSWLSHLFPQLSSVRNPSSNTDAKEECKRLSNRNTPKEKRVKTVISV
jgi:hypothetical protein